MNILEVIARTYAEQEEAWQRHLQTLSGEVEALLRRQHLHATLKRRVKTLESLSEKRSYLGRNLEGEVEIKDLLGLRIVVPFQEEVEQAVALLHRHYSTSEIERKSEKLSFREFAYDSVHVELPLQHLQPALTLPPGCRQVVEVQVRTILQDAWAEVEHELIYKNHFRFPNNDAIRKKLAAVNASLSLADMIFQEIRDTQKALARWGRERFQAMLDQSSTLLNKEELEQLALEPPLREPGAAVLSMGARSELERHLMAGLKAHNDQDYRTAVHHYSQVLALNPDIAVRSIVFNHRGMAYFMLSRETKALSDFDRSYQCDKRNYRALNNRAMVLRRMGYVDMALDCFAQSLEIVPSQAEVYFLRAQTLGEVERLEEARADLARALAIDPTHTEALALQARLAAKASPTPDPGSKNF
ncbi:MAG TPA: tetratricopeptide repeat protein [Hyphomicrobiales bacterium]|nr:tetratricopeptide repeat protein [Hyphomicrobiales bacterium]